MQTDGCGCSVPLADVIAVDLTRLDAEAVQALQADAMQRQWEADVRTYFRGLRDQGLAYKAAAGQTADDLGVSSRWKVEQIVRGY